MDLPVDTVSIDGSRPIPTLIGGDGAAPIGLPRTNRPQVRGKFLYWGGRKHYVRGVTYGTFRPNSDNDLFPEPDVAFRDLSLIAASGFNAVRTYTTPPEWLFDQLEATGLRAMIGIPWEQHIAFLDSRKRARSIRHTVRECVASCRRHRAVLSYAIGNEIPASIVRWHGRQAVTRFLETLYLETKDVDPDGLVTYVNYPTTEFLELPFLDFAAYNVYLESRETLEPYLAKLHNLAGERPVVMAEVGLDSIRNGEAAQAESLEWQIRSTFAAGCAGAFAFKWTDEWYRGGNDILDWGFGLTTAERVPKPSLTTVSRAMQDAPLDGPGRWPRISVVVCSYNGAGTITDTLRALESLDYPDYEVIVVNDGSTDHTEQVARAFKFQVVTTPNAGLSSARNEGIRRATGEIVAFIDDDAYPDPHWLRYIARVLTTSDVCGVGGPNLLPPEDGTLAECISHAPGGPCHVLETDELAEHIPGCNMAFRKSALDAVDGFDPQFRAAGDDVDLCWRLLNRGWKIGFHPSAVVWHHRRPSIRRYWKQQFGYGKAEALLERKWPQKYNRLGHIPWSGRIYGRGLTRDLGPVRQHVYQGTWGQAPFQSIYSRASATWLSLPLMPEWYLTILFLLALVVLSNSWSPLAFSIPLMILAVAAPLVQAVRSAFSARLERRGTLSSRLARRGAIVALHLIQPLARLHGRLSHGLTFWRRRGSPIAKLGTPRVDTLWSETWRSSYDWLTRLEEAIVDRGAIAFRGGNYDSWDLEVRGGLFGSVRVLMTVEEHGSGKQLLRFRARPILSPFEIAMTIIPGVLSAFAFFDGAWTAGTALAIASVGMLIWQLGDCSVAMTSHVRALDEVRRLEQ
ncbi:MAG TPA: glycosyltransferase [Rhodothermales bacterium]|nr:glycosyltransferase [Rhodothermales bacterium]